MKKLITITLIGLFLVGCQSNLKVANKDQPVTNQIKDETVIQVEKTHDGSFVLKNEDADSKGMNVILEVSGNEGTISVITEEETKTYNVQITDKYVVNEDGTKDRYEWNSSGIVIYEERNLVFVKQ